MTISDIMEAVDDSYMYTLHAHTQWCDARAPMQDFVERAVGMGFTHYGFTPHSPIPFESSCNMQDVDVEPFFAEVDRLQRLYPKIKLYKGMEIDYVDDNWNASNAYFQSLGLDYAISSVHFIPNQEGEYFDIDGRPESFQRKLHENFHDDLRYVVDTFFAQSQKMIASGGFQIIGHMDKIKHNAGTVMPELESTSWYKAHIAALVDAVVSAGVIVEINTKAWKEWHQMFPAQYLWRQLVKAGVPIVVNSDAHYPDRINASRPEALKALRYIISQEASL